MWNPFRSKASSLGKSVIGIDIGSSAIKIVQLKKKGQTAILETYGALALGPYAGAQIGQSTNLSIEKNVEAINDLLREAKITSRKAGVAIPAKSSLTTLLSLPAASAKQVDTIVPIEARKYIPVPISEVTIDWSVIPHEKPAPGENDSTIDVLLVAIHNDALNRYQDSVRGAKLETSFFEIEIFSAMRSVLDQDAAPLLILDMGASTTKLYIIEKGVIRTSHTINRGSQEITQTISKSLQVSVDEAERLKRSVGLLGTVENRQISDSVSLTLDFIFGEANRVIANYRKKNKKGISKVVMIGGGAVLKGLKERAMQQFETEVVMGDAFGKVQVPAFLVNILRETGPEFAVAMGVALRRLQEED